MKRVLLCVSYDGTGYSGSQVQKNARTIEGELNKALTDLTGVETEVIGASRTDAGVHSLSSMFVFDTDMRMPADRFSYALNTYLTDDIRVVYSKEVPPDFHPRHVNSLKTYEYHIYNAFFMPPTKRLYAFHEKRPLDVSLMNEGGKFLIGVHDFKSFCSADTASLSTVRNITDLKVFKEEDEVIISVTGQGFLYNQVRIIAGTLMWVGLGVRKPSDVYDILNVRNRSFSGPTAPANGLILKNFQFLDFPLDTEDP